MKVLVIEDDSEVVQAICLTFELRWPGVSIVSTTEGSQGIEMVETESPDLVLMELKGGCRLPVAGLAGLKGDALSLDGLVANVDGSIIVREVVTGPPENPRDLGATLAHRLLDKGARKILDGIYK